MFDNGSDVTELPSDDSQSAFLTDVAYHIAGHVLVDLDTGRRPPWINPPYIHLPRLGFMCHDQVRVKRQAVLRSCAGPCAQALYRWQLDGGEVTVLPPALRMTPVSLASATHERTGQTLDNYVSQAFRSGGYHDYRHVEDEGLLVPIDEDETDYDDQASLAKTCDFLIGRWPLVERIAMALRSSPTSLSYKDVLLLKDAPPKLSTSSE